MVRTQQARAEVEERAGAALAAVVELVFARRDGRGRPPMSRLSSRVLSPALLLLCAACGSEDESGITVDHPTLVAVAPNDFLQDLECFGEDTEVTRYVATLRDVSVAGQTEGAEFPLPSSEPLPCEQIAAFARVVVGHRYLARIDAYDRTDLQPLAPGSPTLMDPETGVRVGPHFQTECGELDDSVSSPDPADLTLEGVLAVDSVTRYARICLPWSTLEPPTPQD